MILDDRMYTAKVLDVSNALNSYRDNYSRNGSAVFVKSNMADAQDIDMRVIVGGDSRLNVELSFYECLHQRSTYQQKFVLDSEVAVLRLSAVLKFKTIESPSFVEIATNESTFPGNETSPRQYFFLFDDSMSDDITDNSGKLHTKLEVNYFTRESTRELSRPGLPNLVISQSYFLRTIPLRSVIPGPRQVLLIIDTHSSNTNHYKRSVQEAVKKLLGSITDDDNCNILTLSEHSFLLKQNCQSGQLFTGADRSAAVGNSQGLGVSKLGVETAASFIARFFRTNTNQAFQMSQVMVFLTNDQHFSRSLNVLTSLRTYVSHVPLYALVFSHDDNNGKLASISREVDGKAHR